MDEQRSELRIEVVEADDLRQERLAHDLIECLAGADVVPRFLDGPSVPDQPTGDRKNLAEHAPLLISVAASPAIARVIVELIRAWCARDRNRRVRIVDGDRSIELPARLDARQERLLQDFVAEYPRPRAASENAAIDRARD